ncbi:PaaI family thioesterase [Herpetosiphon sp. NSE202]|uniref:PaaI family thioesterase n=1 Tax=Herpetosiphon sp. NSE202 TaxID=3351349 RepID=UPI003628EDE9
MVSTTQPAFQDQLQGNHCWGCGKDNPHGLQIKSYWDDAEAICHWQPQAWHCASPTHVLNGGIIGALIDCHSIISAMALAAQQAGVALSSPTPIWYVTGKLEIAYHKPTPLGPSVALRARFDVQNERKTLVTCTLSAGDQLCATGTVLAVRVPSEWMQA